MRASSPLKNINRTAYWDTAKNNFTMTTTEHKVRIDKWLWASRFFKTRSLAKLAIENGKVRIGGGRVKPSREIEVGTVLDVRQGWEEKTVEVLELSDRRCGAPEAQKRYRETEDSIKKRHTRSEEKRAYGLTAKTPGKPTTKERRQLQRIKRQILDGEN